MANQELKNFIEQSKAAGRSEDQIKQDLLSAGWTEESIREGLSPTSESVINYVSEPSQGVQSQTAEVKYAGFWVRFAANIIDGIIISVPAFAIGFAAILSGANETLVNFSMMILVFTFFIFMIMRYQATPGKMVMGIVIVSVDFQRISLGQVILREVLGKLLSSILYIGYIMIAFTQKKQGLHDIIAKTVVVYKDPSKSNKSTVIAVIAGVIFLIVTVGGIFAAITMTSLNSAKNKAKLASFRSTVASINPSALFCADESSLNSINPGIGQYICADASVENTKYPILSPGICDGDIYKVSVDDSSSADGKYKYTVSCDINGASKTFVCSENGCI